MVLPRLKLYHIKIQVNNFSQKTIIIFNNDIIYLYYLMLLYKFHYYVYS